MTRARSVLPSFTAPRTRNSSARWRSTNAAWCREIENLEKMIAEEPRPTLYPEGPFLNCMSRDHILVELKYVRAAIGILRDPIRNKKLDGYFYINFGNRDFENFNQKKD